MISLHIEHFHPFLLSLFFYLTQNDAKGLGIWSSFRFFHRQSGRGTGRVNARSKFLETDFIDAQSSLGVAMLAKQMSDSASADALEQDLPQAIFTGANVIGG